MQKDVIIILTIYSEYPENDLWRELLQYSYEANIKRYLSKKQISSDEETINCIAGSFLQAFEYYKSAKQADIQIAPLLLYYGSSNLFYGMINLLSGNINKIENHGMKLLIPSKMTFIADADIRFVSPTNGGVNVIGRKIGFNSDLTVSGNWKLKEFLDSVAEINADYTHCYDLQAGRIAMLDVFNTPDGKAEKIYFTEENKETFTSLFSEIEDFDKSYLRITIANEYQTNRKYFVLRHNLLGKDISDISYSGQPYLRAGHKKNGKLITIPTMLNMYIALFALASLCRYHPERWSPFVQKDTTGEKLLIEKFLFFARRMLPNYILNHIANEKVQYTSNRYSEKNTIKLVGEHQVQEIVERKLQEQFDRHQIKEFFKQ